MLVGNKVDVVNEKSSMRKVKFEDAQDFANDFGLMFCETSAITNVNVTSAFEDLL